MSERRKIWSWREILKFLYIRSLLGFFFGWVVFSGLNSRLFDLHHWKCLIWGISCHSKTGRPNSDMISVRLDLNNWWRTKDIRDVKKKQEGVMELSPGVLLLRMRKGERLRDLTLLYFIKCLGRCCVGHGWGTECFCWWRWWWVRGWK